MRGRRVVAAAGIAGVLLLAGCSSDHNSSSGADAKAAPAMAANGGVANGGAAKPQSFGGTPASPASPASGAPGAAAAPVTDGRDIAYTAQLTVEVHQVETAAETARRATEAAGGYVASETDSGGQKGSDGDPYEVRLTLKVPSADHQQSLDRLSALGRPLALSSQAEDVTQQVVDVESRLKTQQASVDRVRALMAEAKSLSEVVALEGELSHREADLESLQQQQRALAARTSMSTITLDLVHADQAAPPPATHHGFWSSVGGALSGGWHVLLAIAKGLLIALAAAAPFLILLAPVAWYLRRRRRSRAAAPETPAE